nr:reverse transcriptase domain-containing protein [Tanacetum cinerariifolium]
NYLPEVRKELKIYEAKSDKSSVDEPPEVELKDLPLHLEHNFLEGDDKFPVIIAKDLSVEEKTALITILKSHKRAIAWKLSDIKGIVLGHKISKEGIEVDKAKVDVIAKLPHPTTVKCIRSFLGHAGFYRRNSWFFNNSSGGNPTLTFEPILSNSSPSHTPFEGSDFILEEIEAYLKDESVSPEIDHANCDSEGDICLIEKLLNDDPFQLLPMDLKQGEVVKAKSLIKEPPELELKDLPSHLEYAYLEGVDKLPVIIAKDLKVDEKSSFKSA